MTNISLSPGEPITYDFLQDMVTKINDLERRITSTAPTVVRQNIRVLGSGFRLADNITIVSGTRVISLANGNNIRPTITFDLSGGFQAIPNVVASISDIDAAGADIIDPPKGMLSIGAVTKVNFQIRLDLVTVNPKNTQIKVNYIAIGKA